MESSDQWNVSQTWTRLKFSQERYKRNYEKRLRRDVEKINTADNVYLHVERRDEKETRHKIPSIAQGSFPVKDVKKVAKAGNQIPWSLHGEFFSITSGSHSGDEYHQSGAQSIIPMKINELIMEYKPPEKENWNETHIRKRSLKPSGKLPRASKTKEGVQTKVDEVVRTRE